MVQVIEQSDRFGKIGKSFGEGLAEQIPKEIDRYRLSSGLRDLERDSPNLTRSQQYLRAASIPNIPPQVLQGLPPLLREQNQINDYRNAAGQNTGQGGVAPLGPSGPMPAGPGNVLETPGATRANVAGATKEAPIEGSGEGIVNKNPTSPGMQLRPEWTQDQRNAYVGNLTRDFPNTPIPELQAMAREAEQSYRSQPLTEQEELTRQQGVRTAARNEYERVLQLLSHKDLSRVIADVPGEVQNREMKRMEKELKRNPNTTMEKEADKAARRSLHFIETGDTVKAIANQGMFDADNSVRLKKLKEAGKTYGDYGYQKTYYQNLQKTKNDGGLDLSPGKAASIAYPVSDKLDSVINAIPKQGGKHSINAENREKQARSVAIKVQDALTKDQSLLAIMEKIKSKDRFFDENSFWDEMGQNREILSPEQLTELSTNRRGLVPTWGDFWLFPGLGVWSE